MSWRPSTGSDPDVTAFLTCWEFEELWHGEAFSRLFGEAGVHLPADLPVVHADDPRSERAEWIRRALGRKGYLWHIGTLLGSAAFKDFVAIHMTWGAANELTTLSAYHRLIAKTEHPQLVQMLQAIIKDERRHFAFYRAQARLRLHGPTAQRSTRWAMDHLWARSAPGYGRSPRLTSSSPISSTMRWAAALKEMDGTIAELPGLGGTHYLSEAAERCAERMGLPFGL